ncbi:MAG: glycosyltransferase family 4 protein [Actinomycetota bacterium]
MEKAIRVALTLEQCWHRVPGGTAVAAIGMARALAARDDVAVVGVAALHREPPPAEWTPPVEVRQLRLPRLALYEAWHRLRRPRVERATGDIELIHASSIAIPPRTKPLVVTIHDLLFLRQPEHFTRRGLGFFHRGLRLALKDADLALCSSHATMSDCLEAGFDESRLRHVPLGVDATRADPARIDAVRRHYGLEGPFVLWTGTVEPRKNLRRLLEAWRALARDDVELVLVGPKGWHEDLDAMIGDARRTVKTMGFVPRHHLEALYAGARVFCFPSLLEGFGFPVLEAMAQGTPVITSRGTSTEELAGDAAILVDPGDPSSIAEGIASVLDDAALHAKLSDAGPERAARYSWTNTADLIVTSYRELVG